MAKEGVVKFVEEVPGKQGGFGGGGGHAMDLSPIVEELKANPGKWALIEEGRMSLGSLQRLPVEFDIELRTRQAAKRTYTGKDGKEKVSFLIDVFGRYVEGFSAKHVEALKKRAEERGTGYAVNTLIHKKPAAQTVTASPAPATTHAAPTKEQRPASKR